VDSAIVVTYRCNAHCTMCNTWQFPTKPAEEFEPALLRKLPYGMGRVNITGGEPLIREDLDEIVEILAPRARRLEISTNGWFTDRLVAIGRRHPEITVRISLEGLAPTNDRIRGLEGGFDRALRSFHGLREAGVKDLGFAVTIQDGNADDILNLYEMVSGLEAQFALAVPHNGYYFHKHDNRIADPERVQAAIGGLIAALLQSPRPKEWFRAYLAKGLIDYVAGSRRRLACTAGTDIFFLDPFGELYPCNAWELSMGNLRNEDFAALWEGATARGARAQTATCENGCWMTGTAVPAMRRHLPAVACWVAWQKLRLAAGWPTTVGR
jgi:Fe-coproporphyrin III synthase